MTPPPPLPGPDAGLNAAVAAELRAQAARRRVTIQRLADDAGVPYGSVRRYMGAERHIDVATLDVLARALGTTAADVVQAAVREDRLPSVTEPELAAHLEEYSIEDEQEGSTESP